MKTLVAKQIGKRFTSPSELVLLHNVDLEVAPGESVAIIGPSGVGKSTLLHILGTLEDATEGSLTILGKETKKTALTTLRNRSVGFIFQSYHLFEELTVFDNVLMPARIGGNLSPDRIAYAEQLLVEVGLGGRRNFLVKLLSGGEKQRVAIARALCNDPDLILADEPTGNLDEIHGAHVRALLLNLCKKKKKALIIVTHDNTLADACDAVYLLKEKRLHPL